MKKSAIDPLPAYFDRYIIKCDEVDLLEALQISINELTNYPLDRLEKIGDYVYAPGKWTIKDILQHLIDTERIFSYRALAIARKETNELPSYSENEYASVANANTRSINSLVNELMISHRSMKALYESFSAEMLGSTGKSFAGEYSVASIGFIMAGHQRWHFEIIENRYLNKA